MWFSSFLLLLAFTSVMADVEEEIQKCVTAVDFEDLERIVELPDQDELDALCPPMLNFFICIEKVIEDETGMSVEQLNGFFQGTEPGRFLTVYLNIRSLLRDDLCDEDSQLRKDYQDHSPCFKTIDGKDLSEVCEREAHAAYEAYKALEDVAQEEAGENPSVDNQLCMITAYKAACAGATIHKECGQEAFDIYMTVMRRSTLFKYGICTEGQMVTVKTKFFDSLDMNGSDVDIFRLAFDLRKRRK